jgi:hypothetical protein
MDAELLSEDELDRRLRAGDRVDRAALDDEGVVAALATVRAAVEAAALGRPRSSRSWRSAVPARYPRRWVTAGAAAAAVAVASLVGVESFTGGAGGGGLPLAVSPAAAAVLNKVAKAASAQERLSAGQWSYSETEEEEIQPITAAGLTIEVTGTTTDQTWVAWNGAVRTRQVRDGVAPLTERGRRLYRAHEAAFLKLHMGLREGGGEVQLDFLNSAAEERRTGARARIWKGQPPSNPQALLTDFERWVRKSGRTDDQLRGFSLSAQRRELVFDGLLDILRASTPSRLRATAYRALSYLPETKVLGTRTDQLGRSGVAIAFTGDPYTGVVVIVSPSTGDLLEDASTQLRTPLRPAKLPAGLWQTRMLVLRRAIVDSPTSLPDGRKQPYSRPVRVP